MQAQLAIDLISALVIPAVHHKQSTTDILRFNGKYTKESVL
jgi:hypothetical protein